MTESTRSSRIELVLHELSATYVRAPLLIGWASFIGISPTCCSVQLLAGQALLSFGSLLQPMGPCTGLHKSNE